MSFCLTCLLQVWYAASYAEFVNQKIHDISEEERKGNWVLCFSPLLCGCVAVFKKKVAKFITYHCILCAKFSLDLKRN